MKTSKNEIISRQNKIIHYLRKNNYINVSELADIFHVSDTTIRRDIHLLANYGEAIWQKLVYPSSNICMVICGHECEIADYKGNVSFRTDKNSTGKNVAQMMFNAQTADGQWHGNGGDCWLRIMEFMPDGKTIKIKTFSPLFALSPLTSEKAWRTDSYDQFDITIE